MVKRSIFRKIFLPLHSLEHGESVDAGHKKIANFSTIPCLFKLIFEIRTKRHFTARALASFARKSGQNSHPHPRIIISVNYYVNTQTIIHILAIYLLAQPIAQFVFRFI